MTIPVNKVNGIGPKTTEYLKTKNITTVAALVKHGVTKLADAPGFSQGRATTAINEAKQLMAGSSGSSPSKATSEKSTTAKSDKKNKKNKASKDKKNKKGKKEKKKNKKKSKK